MPTLMRQDLDTDRGFIVSQSDHARNKNARWGVYDSWRFTKIKFSLLLSSFFQSLKYFDFVLKDPNAYSDGDFFNNWSYFNNLSFET